MKTKVTTAAGPKTEQDGPIKDLVDDLKSSLRADNLENLSDIQVTRDTRFAPTSRSFIAEARGEFGRVRLRFRQDSENGDTVLFHWSTREDSTGKVPVVKVEHNVKTNEYQILAGNETKSAEGMTQGAFRELQAKRLSDARRAYERALAAFAPKMSHDDPVSQGILDAALELIKPNLARLPEAKLAKPTE